jgi:hypothetical protein
MFRQPAPACKRIERAGSAGVHAREVRADGEVHEPRLAALLRRLHGHRLPAVDVRSILYVSFRA